MRILAEIEIKLGELENSIAPATIIEELLGAANKGLYGEYTGRVVKVLPDQGALFYYLKADVPEVYAPPTEAQYTEMVMWMNPDTSVTYEKFCQMSERNYAEMKSRGYGLAVQSKHVEYMDGDHLERIKDEIRKEDGFVGFPDDPGMAELLKNFNKIFDK